MATPWALVTPESVVMVDWAPLFWLKETVWPEIGVPSVSVRVAVMVVVDVPSSGTDVGLATTVDTFGSRAPWKATWAVLVKVAPPVTSSAL